MKRHIVFGFLALSALALSGSACAPDEIIVDDDLGPVVVEPAENAAEPDPAVDVNSYQYKALRCGGATSKCSNPNRCVNLKTDSKNCGKCGKRCSAGASCKNSKCVRPIIKDAGPKDVHPVDVHKG